MSAEEWYEVLERMTAVWEKFTSTVKEMADSIADLLTSVQEEDRKKQISTPRQYGMSLLSRRKSDLWRRSCRLNYVPVAPKNRPYQRRNS